ncbi:nucleotidyltransferase family protein [Micrococcus sp. FDAARGOS_333]|uniref:nucleotidyltransferase family protein n=1 Tax=Micrococcus sp. FDAARGOS_333 TaxID=1930558 RepID=UPI001D126D5F|nr:nucleotidyltransferase family protein [Micrococcus sp. FDAARGOS_333]
MVPLRARLLLAHATLTHALADAGIRALHIKGYAALDGAYVPERSSTDVDLLVHPDDAPQTLRVLAQQGWPLVTDFSEGSIFMHAATLRHVQLGYVDVHRLFPGIGIDPAEAFERLWAARVERMRAGRPLPVVDLQHQRLLIILHAARDVSRRRLDVSHIRRTVSEDAWESLRRLAVAFRAQAAWEAATDETLAGAAPRQTALFRAMNSNKTGLELFGHRWAAADGLGARARLVRDTLGVNRAHLAMDLRREVTAGDVLRWQWRRLRQVATWGAAKVRSTVATRKDRP